VMNATVDFPLPDVNYAPLRPFWSAASERRLVFPQCPTCRSFQWYPRPKCPQCGGTEYGWAQVADNARIFSWTVVRRALYMPLRPIAPYVPVILEFDDAPGVRLVSRWLHSDATGLVVGGEVGIVFEDLGYPRLHTGILAPMVQSAAV
jgi:uncharacterized protein